MRKIWWENPYDYVEVYWSVIQTAKDALNEDNPDPKRLRTIESSCDKLIKVATKIQHLKNKQSLIHMLTLFKFELEGKRHDILSHS